MSNSTRIYELNAQQEMCKLKTLLRKAHNNYNATTWSAFVKQCEVVQDALTMQDSYFVRGHTYKPYVHRWTHYHDGPFRTVHYKCTKCNHKCEWVNPMNVLADSGYHTICPKREP